MQFYLRESSLLSNVTFCFASIKLWSIGKKRIRSVIRSSLVKGDEENEYTKLFDPARFFSCKLWKDSDYVIYLIKTIRVAYILNK